MQPTGPPHTGGDSVSPVRPEPVSLASIDTALQLFEDGKVSAFHKKARWISSAFTVDDHAPSLALSRKLNQLGMCLFNNGYARDALTVYKQALLVYEALETPNAGHQSDLYNNLGQAEARRSRSEKAISYLEKAVSIRESRFPDSTALAVVYDNLGAVYTESGRLAQAKALHTRALDIFERKVGPFSGDTATTLGNLSNAFLEAEDFQKAEAYRLRALDAHQRAYGPLHSETLLDMAMLAVIQLRKGDDDRLDHYVNMLLSAGRAATAREHRSLAEKMTHLIESAWSAFRLDIAERLSNQAIHLLTETEGQDAPETLSAIFLLANVQRATSQDQPALENYQRVQAGFIRLKMPLQAAKVSIEIAKIYRERKAYPVAQEILDAVIAQLEEAFADVDPELIADQKASAYLNLAYLYFYQEDPDRADEYYARALSAIELQPDHAERPNILHNWAMLHYHTGNYPAAREKYLAAMALWRQRYGDSHPHVATTAANLALVHWALGEPDAATRYFAEAETLRDREMRKIIAVGSETKRMAYARNLQSDLFKVVSFCVSMADCPPALAEFTAQMLLRRKGRVLDAMAQTTRQVRATLDPAMLETFDRLRAVWKKIADLMSPALIHYQQIRDPDPIRVLRAEEERLEAQLSYTGATIQSGLETVDIDAVRSALPDGAVLIEMLRFSRFDPDRSAGGASFGEERYVAMVLGRKDPPKWIDLGSAAAIDAGCDALMRCLRNDRQGMAAYEAAAAALYRQVVHPLEDGIRDAGQLLIAPDGHLSTLPFGLLIDGAGRRLATRKIVSYLNSGRELLAIQAFRGTGSGITVVADPDFDTRPEPRNRSIPKDRLVRARLAPLPGAREEATAIDALFEKVACLVGTEASCSAVMALNAPAVLHLATHGIFAEFDDPDPVWKNEILPVGDRLMMISRSGPDRLANPMFSSGLALSGANRRDADGNKGVLTAQEITAMNLGGTQLVVLSACDTGLGTARLGEEFMGLRRALAIAGAATQVTSLWRVDDAATRTLMTHYYRSLAQGADRVAALSGAQAAVENDPQHPRWRHPCYWGAFISSGDWRPLDGMTLGPKG